MTEQLDSEVELKEEQILQPLFVDAEGWSQGYFKVIRREVATEKENGRLNEWNGGNRILPEDSFFRD